MFGLDVQRKLRFPRLATPLLAGMLVLANRSLVLAQPPPEFDFLQRQLKLEGWAPQNKPDYPPPIKLSDVSINGQRVHLKEGSELRVVWCLVGGEVRIPANKTMTVTSELDFVGQPARFDLLNGRTKQLKVGSKPAKLMPLEQSSEKTTVKPAGSERILVVFQQGYQFETHQGTRILYTDVTRKIVFERSE